MFWPRDLINSTTAQGNPLSYKGNEYGPIEGQSSIQDEPIVHGQ